MRHLLLFIIGLEKIRASDIYPFPLHISFSLLSALLDIFIPHLPSYGQNLRPQFFPLR